MTIDDMINIKSCNIDKTTGIEISHREKNQRIIDLLGFENVKKCIPFTLDEIKKALPNDQYLNNLSIENWRTASGVIVNDYACTSYIVSTPLVSLYRKHGINCFSQSDGVSLLKECARIWTEL